MTDKAEFNIVSFPGPLLNQAAEVAPSRSLLSSNNQPALMQPFQHYGGAFGGGYGQPLTPQQMQLHRQQVLSLQGQTVAQDPSMDPSVNPSMDSPPRRRKQRGGSRTPGKGKKTQHQKSKNKAGRQ